MPSCCVIALLSSPLFIFHCMPPFGVCTWMRTSSFLGARTSVIVKPLRDGANLTFWGSVFVSKPLLMLPEKDDRGWKWHFLKHLMVWTFELFGLRVCCHENSYYTKLRRDQKRQKNHIHSSIHSFIHQRTRKRDRNRSRPFSN